MYKILIRRLIRSSGKILLGLMPIFLFASFELQASIRSEIAYPLSHNLAVSVSGTISDENGDPLPGATITVLGTSQGTVSDLDGKFSITVPDGATLVFSYIGYKTQSIAVGTQSTIDVQLLQDESSLSEVLVVGYGT